METVILLLGSNMGDRLGYLAKASDRISHLIGKITGTSAVYESSPWGFSDAVNFFNQVLAVGTALDPEEVLTTILSIERSLGRSRQADVPVCDKSCSSMTVSSTQNPLKVMEYAGEKLHYQARTIDIDILFYGQRMVFTERLMIPHPRLHLRKFTLVPLMEIFPDFIHPLLKKNITELADSCPDRSDVKRVPSTFTDDMISSSPPSEESAV